MHRMLLPARATIVTITVAAAAVIAAAAGPAYAGDQRPPTATYALPPAGDALTSATIVSQQVGRPSRTAQTVASGTGLRFAPSVSHDGRVMSYLRMKDPSGLRARLIVKVDGRAVLKRPGAASWPDTTSDGSAVTWVEDAGRVRSYDVARGSTRVVCGHCGSGAGYAALSPDRRFLAVRSSSNIENVIKIIRLSDRTVVASAKPAAASLDTRIAWRPDSTRIAYTDITSEASSGTSIAVLGIDGSLAATAFADESSPDTPVYYCSPAWIGGQVWAIRVELMGAKRARIEAVSARSWAQRPTVAPRPLRTISSLSPSAFLSMLVAWSAPTSSRRA